MAITVGTSTTATNSGTSITINTPTASTGDTLIAIVAKDDDVAVTYDADWTQIEGGESNNAIYYQSFKRLVDGTEATSYTFSGDNESYTAVIIPISGADYTTVTAPAFNTSTTGTATSPAPTTTADDYIVIAGSAWDTGQTVTPDADLTSVANINVGGNGGVSLTTGYEITPATQTTYAHTSDSDQNIGYTITIDSGAVDVTATSESLTLAAVAQTVTALKGLEVTQTADSLALAPASQTVQANVDTNVAATFDGLAISPLTQTITRDAPRLWVAWF